MQLTLLLSWCAMVSALCLMGRVLTRSQGRLVGLLAAAFWIIAIQAFSEKNAADPRFLLALGSGALTLVAASFWMSGKARADSATAFSTSTTPRTALDRKPSDLRTDSTDDIVNDRHRTPVTKSIADVLDQFEDWLGRQRNAADPWPAFGEFVRSSIHQICRGGQVRLYRVTGESGELDPLDSPATSSGSRFARDSRRLSTRAGMIGHVVTTGRSYLAGDAIQGALIGELALQTQEPCAWCFAIVEGTRKLGLVTVGQLSDAPLRDRASLHCVEMLVSQMWRMLEEVLRSAAASTTDSISGLLSRKSFLEYAATSLQESYQQGEPAALAVIGFEGLRTLDDHGEWEGSTRFIREAAALLRQKVRTDDVLGRFDDARFMLLLRRVDSALASLIMKQLMDKLSELSGRTRTGQSAEKCVVARCGLVGSGIGAPTLQTLLTSAIRQCHTARRSEVAIASDLGSAAKARREPGVTKGLSESTSVPVPTDAKAGFAHAGDKV